MYKDKCHDVVPPNHKFGPANVKVHGDKKDYDGSIHGSRLPLSIPGGASRDSSRRDSSRRDSSRRDSSRRNASRGDSTRGDSFNDSGDELSGDINTNRTVGSAALACVYLMIGANIMLTYIYSIHWHLKFMNNLHILFCSAGFQLLIPMGILMHSKVNVPSQSLTKEERTKQHMLLQISGAAMGIIGAICVVLFGETMETKWSLHCLTGIVTVVFAVVSLVFGAASKMRSKVAYKFSAKHPVYGVAAYLLSSICFILGTIKNDFIVFVPMFLGPDIVYLVIIFCSISTLIVIYVPLRHIKERRNK